MATSAVANISSQDRDHPESDVDKHSGSSDSSYDPSEAFEASDSGIFRRQAIID